MGVDHGGGDIGMTKQLLHGADVGAVRQQMCGEGMAQGVGSHPLGEIRRPRRLADGTLQRGVLDMMAPPDAAARIDRQLPGREKPLLGPLRAGCGDFILHGRGQPNAWQIRPPVFLE